MATLQKQDQHKTDSDPEGESKNYPENHVAFGRRASHSLSAPLSGLQSIGNEGVRCVGPEEGRADATGERKPNHRVPSSFNGGPAGRGTGHFGALSPSIKDYR